MILDARYERFREAGVILNQAVLIAVSVGCDGLRSVLGVELANLEIRSSCRDFLLSLKSLGLHVVEFVVAYYHSELRASLREVLSEATCQRCYVHFLRNALYYLPRKVDHLCLLYRVGSITVATSTKLGASRCLAVEVSWQILEAVLLRLSQHLRDSHLLPPALSYTTNI